MDSGVDLTAVSEPRQLASDLCRSASIRGMNGPYRSDRSFFFAQVSLPPGLKEPTLKAGFQDVINDAFKSKILSLISVSWR